MAKHVNQMRPPGVWQRRVLQPLLRLLRQGLTPEKLALSIALALVVGIIPVAGMSTLLCVGLAFPLRLNLPAMMAVNQTTYPLQIALALPFLRAGEWIWRAAPLPLSVSQISAMLRADPLGTFAALWHSILHAATAWLLAAPLLTLLLYMILRPLLSRLNAATGLHPLAAGVKEAES